jgi:hypothetical protein
MMKEKMRECRDVDELSYVHTQFTSSLQYQCLLSDKVQTLYPRYLFLNAQLTQPKLSTIHNSILDILTLSITFTEKYLNLKNELLSPPNPHSHNRRHTRTSSLTDDEENPVTSIQETVTETEFLDYVRYLDDRIIRAIPFIRSGLKGSVRAAEFGSLGILAGSLEAGVR